MFPLKVLNNPSWFAPPPLYHVSTTSSLLMFRDHTQTHTLGRTPPDECLARRSNIYLTTHNPHKRQTSTYPHGFRTRNPSKRKATDICLRPLGHRDRPTIQVIPETYKTCSFATLTTKSTLPP
jgi:hypothetical protein